jgi:integrase
MVTVAEAVTAYERGALALMAEGTGHTYRTWTRRLLCEIGESDVGTVTAGELTDVIARYAGVERGGRRGRGRSAEENAVAAYRHLWGYLVEKGYARVNVATRLRKPSRGEPNRRAIRVDEAALLRQLARSGRDALLDEVTLSLAERLGLRRIEICRLRLCDVDLRNAEAKVWGKGDKDRIMPVPPQLAGLLERYIDDRRPAGCQPSQWARSGELLLRRRPGPAHPDGAPTGRRRIEELFARMARSAPDLFAGGDLSLHSYRHALATYVDGRWGRAVTRAVLGHTSRRSPTDYYVHVDPAKMAEVLTAYEHHLLAGNDHATDRRGPTMSR